MEHWYSDPVVAELLSTGILRMLARQDCNGVGLYASLAVFDVEPAANTWPSHRKAVA